MLSNLEVLSEIVQSSKHAILTVDGEGAITSFNRAAQNLLGFSATSGIGRMVSDFVVSPAGHRWSNFEDFHNAYSQRIREAEIRPVKGDATFGTVSSSTLRGTHDCYLIELNEHHEGDGDTEEVQTNSLEALTSNVPAVLFQSRYNRERHMDFISPTITTLCGWEKDDFTDDVITYRKLMSAEDEARIWKAIGTSFIEDVPYTVEYRMFHRSGRTLWVSENGRVVLNSDGLPHAIVGSLTDNTEIKTRSTAFEGTVNALNRATAVIEFDMQGRVTNANEQFLGLMGYTIDEVRGHHHRLFCTESQSQSQEYVEFWQKLQSGQFDEGEYLRVSKSGEEVWIQATYNPIFDADGKPYKVMKFATDLSDRRDMEETLRTAMKAAEQAVEARGSFMASMSHEIRTPMNAVIGFTETTLSTDLNEEQRRYLSIVLNASKSLLRLLNEILDMSKLDEGAVELEMRDFNFETVCQQVVGSLALAAEKNNSELVVEIDPEVPTFLHGDSLRIQQILLNLVSNSCKFTENGVVTMRAKYLNRNLVLEVEDTGIGMSQEFLARIFEPFSQSDASTTRKYGGTGLGTSIVKRLVDLMEGTIEIESEVGVGSKFTVTVPMALGDEVVDFREFVGEIHPLNVLCVDDTPTSLELLCVTLERQGHTTTQATNGQEAVDIYKENEFDLIVTDLQMPVLDGYEATKRIRTYEQTTGRRKTPIVGLSAHVLPEFREKALSMGMSGFANKPLEPSELFSVFANVLPKKFLKSDVEDWESTKQLKADEALATTAKGIDDGDTEQGDSPGESNVAVAQILTSAEPTQDKADSNTQDEVAAEADELVEVEETLKDEITENEKIENETSQIDPASGATSTEAENTVAQAALDADAAEPQEGAIAEADEVDNSTEADAVEAGSIENDEAVAAAEGKPVEKFAETDEDSVINWQSAIKLWGDKALFTRSLQRFTKETESALEAVEANIESEEFLALSALGHKIKGASGNLRLTTMQKLASEFEAAANSEDSQKLREVSGALSEALNVVCINLQKSLDGQAKTDQGAVGLDELLELTERLQLAAQRNEFDHAALDRFSAHDSDQTREIVDLYESFEFVKALEKLEELKKDIGG